MKDKDTTKAIAFFLLCLIVLLFVGWFLMTSHVGSSSYDYVLERALPYPYVSWVGWIEFGYWTIGAISLTGFILAVWINPKKEKIIIFLAMVPVFLFAFGLIINYLIALIKLGSEHFLPIFIIGFIVFISLLSYFILKLGKSGYYLVTILVLTFSIFSGILLWLSEPTNDLYLIVKKGHVLSSFSTKALLTIIIFLSTGIIAFVFGGLVQYNFSEEEKV
ncbi:hypothetical protein [Neobacillus sp. LXY-4]|uniref:hypothetical protein n=1 Tax=Neobacillus sp. LXY-4 TaxID=3379826 RepID=UPI003EE3566B